MREAALGEREHRALGRGADDDDDDDDDDEVHRYREDWTSEDDEDEDDEDDEAEEAEEARRLSDAVELGGALSSA